MKRFSAVIDELQTCRSLVEEAATLIRSVPVLKGSNKQQVETLLQRAMEELNVTGVFVRACHNI